MIYQVDSARVSVREYLAGPMSLKTLLVLPIALVMRLFRVRFMAAYDEPPIHEYGPYRVSDSEIEPEFLDKLLPVENELAELGFHSPVYHAVEDGQLTASFRMVTLRHDSGEAIARAQFRKWAKPSVPKREREKVLISFMSMAADGSEVQTTNVGPDFTLPPDRSVKVLRHLGAADLWAEHQRAIDEVQRNAPLKLVSTQPELLRAIDDWQRRYVDVQCQRGVFIEPTDDVIQRRVLEDGRPSIELADADAPVLAEIAKSQQASSNWKTGLLVLAVTIVLFLSLGSAAWSLEFAALLVPILLFHELGHLAAMRMFKYRNLKMFFIPLFGAAVTGRHYNVPGWKKAIVSLAGPVPGIAVGAALSIMAMALNSELLTKAAGIALIVNAFNLLPILPLDGGWVAHTLFFSRHPLVDASFRAVTALLLLLGSWAVGDRILLALGIVMLVGIPWAYRLAKIAAKLRKEGLDATPTVNDEPPLNVTKRVIHEVRESSPTPLKTKQVATLAVRIIETLNARAPGIAATLGLALVHLSSVVVAIVFGAVLLVHHQGGFLNLMAAAASRGETPVECGDHEQALGDAAGLDADTNLVIANLEDSASAEQLYGQAVAEAADVSVTRFGSSVLVAVPADDAALKNQWFEWLDSRAPGVFVATDKSPAVFTISAIAPDDRTAAEVEQLMSEYFAGAAMHLIPPWAPGFALTDQQARARRTYRRLVLERGDALGDDAEFARLDEQWAEATRRGDDKAAEEVQRRIDELTAAAEVRRLDNLRAEGAASVDLELIDIYQEHEAETSSAVTVEDAVASDFETRLAEIRKRQEAWERRVGERMGQLPLEGDSPAGADLAHAARTGAVVRTGLSISFPWLNFHRADAGAPRLADWLCERGFVDVRYTIQSPLYDEEL